DQRPRLTRPLARARRCSTSSGRSRSATWRAGGRISREATRSRRSLKVSNHLFVCAVFIVVLALHYTLGYSCIGE
ncbi:hypothetical protein BDY17DRAFT_263973, partial [Neohortaea acidophila]